MTAVDQAAVRLAGVSVTYHPRQGEAVRGIDEVTWTLPSGTSAAVVGRSGSGKSTLIAVLSLMRRPTSGAVEVLGHSVARLSASDAARLRATSIGVVFQAFHLDPRQPLWWNVALPWVFSGGCDLQAARHRAEGLLERVGLDGMAKRRASELSGGQKQRVAVGRALMSGPSLFIADEPTGNLDEDTANSVADLIYGLADDGQVSVVVVTHDHEIASRADQEVRLAHGKLSSGGLIGAGSGA